MTMPKVSICIPTYNGEVHIEKAVESVLKQTYTNFELIIIDDFSIDKTKKMVMNFTDDRIRFIENNENIGMVANWNRCLENAKGEYIQFLCQDDYLEKSCLETKVEVLDYHKEVCMVFSSSYIINRSNQIILKRRPFYSSRLLDGHDVIRKSFIRHNIFGEPSNVMFRSDVIKQIGTFDNRLCYSIDWDYWMRIASKGKVYFINEFLVSFRVSATSATNLMRNDKQKLISDDNQFIMNCVQIKDIKLRILDIWLHKAKMIIRMYIRGAYYSYINNRST